MKVLEKTQSEFNNRNKNITAKETLIKDLNKELIKEKQEKAKRKKLFAPLIE